MPPALFGGATTVPSWYAGFRTPTRCIKDCTTYLTYLGSFPVVVWNPMPIDIPISNRRDRFLFLRCFVFRRLLFVSV